jgi:hypothetical protein
LQSSTRQAYKFVIQSACFECHVQSSRPSFQGR